MTKKMIQTIETTNKRKFAYKNLFKNYWILILQCAYALTTRIGWIEMIPVIYIMLRETATANLIFKIIFNDEKREVVLYNNYGLYTQEHHIAYDRLSVICARGWADKLKGRYILQLAESVATTDKSNRLKKISVIDNYSDCEWSLEQMKKILEKAQSIANSENCGTKEVYYTLPVWWRIIIPTKSWIAITEF